MEAVGQETVTMVPAARAVQLAKVVVTLKMPVGRLAKLRLVNTRAPPVATYCSSLQASSNWEDDGIATSPPRTNTAYCCKTNRGASLSKTSVPSEKGVGA